MKSEVNNLCDAGEFIYSMHKSGVDIWITGDRLNYVAKNGITEESIAKLRRWKPEIITILRDRSLASIIKQPLPTPDSDPAPLSIQQEAAWRGRQSANMVAQVVLRLSGYTDAAALRYSLSFIINRHDVLRTRIVAVEGEPKQTVYEATDDVLSVVDASASSPEEQERLALDRIKEILRREIDPERDRLFQAHLVNLSEHISILVIAIHHIVCDGTTLSMLIKELWKVYDNKVHGSSPELEKLPLSYIDYSVWQRNLSFLCRRKNERYWNEVFSRGLDISLPRDNDRDLIAPNTAESLSVSLNNSVSAALRQLARGLKAPLALVVTSAFIESLSQWSGKNEFGLYSIVSGRDAQGVSNVFGFFAKPVYLWINKGEGETFAGLLHMVLREIESALDHLECGICAPSNRADEAVHPIVVIQWGGGDPRSIKEVHIKSTNHALRVESMPVARMPGYYGKAVPALDMHFFDGSSGIYGRGYYRADLFGKETMRRFVERFVRCCTNVVRQP